MGKRIPDNSQRLGRAQVQEIASTKHKSIFDIKTVKVFDTNGKLIGSFPQNRKRGVQ